MQATEGDEGGAGSSGAEGDMGDLPSARPATVLKVVAHGIGTRGALQVTDRHRVGGHGTLPSPTTPFRPRKCACGGHWERNGAEAAGDARVLRVSVIQATGSGQTLVNKVSRSGQGVLESARVFLSSGMITRQLTQRRIVVARGVRQFR